MITRRPLRGAAAAASAASAATLAALLAACGGSTSPSPHSPPQSSAPSAPAPTGTTAHGTTPTGPTPTASGTPPDGATRQAIESAYATFFGTSATTAQSEAVLQHGSVFRATIDEQGKSSYADKSSAKVTAIQVDGDVATVSFTVYSDGKPLLRNFGGYAVREGGRWKVAAKTFCALLTLEGDAPDACSRASITALPH